MVLVPYFGDSVQTPWWHAYQNPGKGSGKLASSIYHNIETIPILGGFFRNRREKILGVAARRFVTPRWEDLVLTILKQENDIEAVIIANIPLQHFSGLPSKIRQRHNIPVVYYDIDAPASLPRFRGREAIYLSPYANANLTEYDLFIVQSEGVVEDLKELGAPKVATLHLGADPEIFVPVNIEKDIDVLYFGMGARGREHWMDQMLARPSRAMTEFRFAYAGGFSQWNWKGIDLGNATYLGSPRLDGWRALASRSRINLNITRSAHTAVYASSASRIFELAALRACIVTNPWPGVETWFQPGREILIVHDAEEAADVYQRLLGDESERGAMADRVYQRFLSEHTHVHRARRLIELLRTLS